MLDALLQDSLLQNNKPASYSVYSFGSPVQLVRTKMCVALYE